MPREAAAKTSPARALAQKSLAALAILGLVPVLPLQAAETAIRATYLCKGRFDAVPLTALFFNASPREVVLLQGEQATRLPQQLSADGGRYASANTSFWVKGDRATWQVGKADPYSCGPEEPVLPGAVKRR